MKPVIYSLCAILWLLGITPSLAQDSSSKAAQAAEFIRAKQYPQALEILSDNLTNLATQAPEFSEDHLILMKARALHLNKSHAEAESTCDTLLQNFPESSWKYKAIFLKAHTLVARGDYQGALKIYEVESNRLFSEERKDEVAKTLLEFADLFATIPAPEDLDAPKPDFEKAYILYKDVLTLQCSHELRERAHYSMIRMSTHLNNWKLVISDCLTYLPKYDPSWKGEMNSQQRVTFQKNTSQNPDGIIGKHRSEVYYRMAEALHRQNSRPLAVRYLDELIEMMKSGTLESPAGLPEDAAWLKLMAMRIKGGHSADIDQWIDAANAYLKDYPNHLHANHTAYMVPSMLASHDKKAEAIKAYQNFLDSPIPVNANPVSLEAESPKAFLTRKEKAEKRREEASYQIGKLHLELLEFDLARAAWKQTTQDFPNGTRWADSQKGQIEIDYQEAMYAIRQIQTSTQKNAAADNASQQLTAFIQKHPLSDRAPDILYLLGKIPHQFAIDLNELDDQTIAQKEEQKALFQKAISNWEELISKYPNSSQAHTARETIGNIYEHHLADFEKALSTYRATNSNQARSRVNVLTSKRLIASSPKVFRTDEKPFVNLNIRNIEKLTIRQYWLDLDSYFRKARQLQNISELDVDLVEADKTWEIKVDAFQKYLPLEQKLSIPFKDERPGVCIIKVEGHEFLSTTVVVRSDIDIAVRSSKDELIALTTNWRQNGSPTAGVELLVADGGKVVATGKTGADGVLHLKSDKLTTIQDLRVLATSPAGSATCSLDLGRLVSPLLMLEKVWFNTPQQWYRPGETVQLSGLLRIPDKGSYQIPSEDKRKWTLRCTGTTKGKLIHESDLTLNDHGSFSTNFVVPENMPHGAIKAVITRKEGNKEVEFETYITVKRQVKDSVILTLDFAKTWTKPGEKITGNVTAKYHWGAPVTDREIEINLPNGLTTKVTTDKDGKANFEYDSSALASGMVAAFSVTMPGETAQTVRKILDIDPLGFSIEAELSHGTIAAGEAFEIIAKTLLPDSSTTSRALTLEVVQQTVQKTDPILGSSAATQSAAAIKEKVVQTFKLTTDEETGLAKQQITLQTGGRFILRIKGKDSRGRLVYAESFIEIYGEDSAQKVRLLVDKNKLLEGGTAKIEAWSRLDSPTHALLSIEANSLVDYRIIQLNPGKNLVEVKLTQRHAPVFRAALMTMHQRKFYSADEILPIERSLKVITQLAGLDENGEAIPGGKLEANIKLIDGNDQPQSGEIFLSMVDQRDAHSYLNEQYFTRSHRLVGFTLGTSCGFQHQGTQSRINLALVAEEQRIANTPNRALRRAEVQIQEARNQIASNTDQIRKKLYTGEGYYNLGKYQEAENEFKDILSQDPYNKPARRWLERIASINSDYYRAAYDQTRAEMLMEVNQAWELPNQVSSHSNIAIGGLRQNLYANDNRSDNTTISSNSIDALLNNPNRNSLNDILGNRNGRGFSNNSSNANWDTFNQRLYFEDLSQTELPLRLTENFHTHEPTLIWALSQKTIGKEGLDLEIPLPNKSGSWKLLTKASSATGSLGHKVDEIRTVLPYDLHLQLPSTVIEGDQLSTTILLTRKNNQGAESIKLSYTATAGENNIVSAEFTINFKAGESTQSVTAQSILVPAADTLQVKVTGEKELTAEQNVRIRPWGLPIADHSSTLLSAGKKTITLQVPEGTHQTMAQLKIQPSISTALYELATRPLASWCGYRIPLHEQHAAGQLLAIASLIESNRENGTADEQQTALISQANRLAANLAITRKNDGGWSSVRGRSSINLGHTAMAFEALTLAKKLNLTVDLTTLDAAKSWLEKQQSSISSNDGDARCLVQYALSTSNTADFSACNRLFRERGKLEDAGKALLAAAFMNLDRPENAKTLLESMAEANAWKRPSSRFACSDIFIAGRALMAAANVAPNSGLTEKFQNIILAQSGVNGFISDLDRGAAIAGLTCLNEKAAAADAEITVNLNGQEIGKFNTNKPVQMASIDIDSKLLIEGENVLSFAMEGNGKLVASATLSGFSTIPDEYKVEKDFTVQYHRYYHDGLSFQGKRLSNKGSSPAQNIKKGERVQVYIQVNQERSSVLESVLIECIPAGFTYERGSLKGSHSGARIEDNHLVVTFDGQVKNRSLRYTMIAQQPGTWRQPPAMLLPINNPVAFVHGKAGSLTVLDRAEENPDTYQTNYSEHNELATLYFNQGNYAKAREHIMAVRKSQPTWENTNNSRMLLWIECASDTPDAKLLVESFEILNERLPELLIPYDKILKVGEAYQTLKEYERGMEVFTASIAAGFGNDAYIGAVLEDQGRYLDAIDYQKELWMLYPDEGIISTAWLSLAQQVYENSAKANELTARKDDKKAPTELELIAESSELFQTFLLANSESPLADDAAFTQANVLFSMKKFKEVVAHALACVKRYPESKHSSSFRYMTALGSFWLRDYDAALKAASEVAQGSSEDKNLASYITAQIYHAKGQPVEASEWYERVESIYPDARESIAYFEQKMVRLDEVQVLKSGAEAKLTLHYRNIKEANIQIYRVDLMKLYLREKNLSNISNINLAGISPKHELNIQLGDGEDFKDREKEITLPMSDDGAYLMICRGDYLYSSGLVLITPLKMEVQEDLSARSLRVNVSDQNTGKYLDNVHVKTIGIKDSKFKTGETDLRGIWKAEDITSRPTIIARDDKGRYAFYRSQSNYTATRNPNSRPSSKPQKPDFKSNLFDQQRQLNDKNKKSYERARRNRGIGVKAKEALKK